MKYKLTLNDRTYEVVVELAEPMQAQEFQSYAPVHSATATQTAEIAPSVTAAVTSGAAGDGEWVEAPMPGNILKVNVVSGQTVKAGEVLEILEAMKMENEIMAHKDGTVTQVLVSKGSTVETGAPLVFIG